MMSNSDPGWLKMMADLETGWDETHAQREAAKAKYGEVSVKFWQRYNHVLNEKLKELMS